MSSSDERSPKRQRRSYSPASPFLDTAKVFTPQPQTPPPSVHMSPSWTSQPLPGLAHPDGVGSGASVAMPTPPSTAGILSQTTARTGSSEEKGAEAQQQTPLSEAKDEPQKDADGDDEMKDAGDEAGKRDPSSAVDADHRRSDHERQEADDALAPLPGPSKLYKLSTEPIVATRPHHSADLIDLYGLHRIQASVARKDPVTGAKINKLRKSYEGKAKDLGLEGRNKASKGAGHLQGLADPGWSTVLGDGRTMWQVRIDGKEPGAASDEQTLALLDSALTLRPGHLPRDEHNEWKSLLGLDDTAIPAKQPANSVAPAVARATTAVPRTAPSTAPQSAVIPNSPRNSAARPDRQGKKRRYDERSYEGYNDGYDDDGYDTGGQDESGRRGSGSKRQKRKDFPPSTVANSPPFNAAGGGNMVGVRSS